MRERLWWLLRRQPLLRRFYERHGQARWVQLVRVLVAPMDRPRWLRVRAGIAAGLRFRLNPRWEHAQWQGDYEPAVQRWLASRSWQRRRVYDVGAGFGYFALALARAGAGVRPLLLVEVHDDQAWAACRERLERAGYRWSWLESQARWPRHLVAEPVTTP